MSDDKNRQIGDRYIVAGGCPQCHADLEVWHGVAVMCVNWQHPHEPTMYNKDGLRNCDYAIMGG